MRASGIESALPCEVIRLDKRITPTSTSGSSVQRVFGAMAAESTWSCRGCNANGHQHESRGAHFVCSRCAGRPQPSGTV